MWGGACLGGGRDWSGSMAKAKVPRGRRAGGVSWCFDVCARMEDAVLQCYVDGAVKGATRAEEALLSRMSRGPAVAVGERGRGDGAGRPAGAGSRRHGTEQACLTCRSGGAAEAGGGRCGQRAGETERKRGVGGQVAGALAMAMAIVYTDAVSSYWQRRLAMEQVTAARPASRRPPWATGGPCSDGR